MEFGSDDEDVGYDDGYDDVAIDNNNIHDSDADNLLSRTADEIQGVVDEGAALLQLINYGEMEMDEAARVKRRVEEISKETDESNTFERVQLVPYTSSPAAAVAAGIHEENYEDPFGNIDDP
jgi:hypothetical protein